MGRARARRRLLPHSPPPPPRRAREGVGRLPIAPAKRCVQGTIAARRARVSPFALVRYLASSGNPSASSAVFLGSASNEQTRLFWMNGFENVCTFAESLQPHEFAAAAESFCRSYQPAESMPPTSTNQTPLH
eukprot:4871860-Pleurochrysis_carterae.AAC.2